MSSSCHCLSCGKEYKYWGCINNHYKKEHPNNTSFLRTIEIVNAMNEEAKSFIKYTTVAEKWV